MVSKSETNKKIKTNINYFTNHTQGCMSVWSFSIVTNCESSLAWVHYKCYKIYIPLVLNTTFSTRNDFHKRLKILQLT